VDDGGKKGRGWRGETTSFFWATQALSTYKVGGLKKKERNLPTATPEQEIQTRIKLPETIE